MKCHIHTMNNNMVIIYGLFDPRNGGCFYVGKTKQDLKRRYGQHLKLIENNSPKENKIKKIFKCGLKPVISELLTVDDYYDPVLKKNYWEYVERYFIQFTRDVLNEPLTNVTKGGDRGSDTSRPVSQFDLNGNFIKTYDSIINASNESHIPYSGIISCCKNKTKSTLGFQWCYIENENKIGRYVLQHRRPVLQFDLKGVFIKRYDSISDAAKENSISEGHIGGCCKYHKGGNPPKCYKHGASAKNFQWCYEGDENNVREYKTHQGGNKKISQFDLNGNFIKKYDSIADAARQNGLCVTHISFCCNSDLKTCGGYQWSYAGNEKKIGRYVSQIERQSRPVLQYDLNGNFIKRYDSIADAARRNNISSSTVGMNLHNKHKTAGGFVWKYAQ